MKTILRNLIFVMGLALGLQTSVKAQLVSVPDSAFRAWLNINYASCMIGDSIDSSCPTLQTVTAMNVSLQNISDLTGIEVFSNLENFACNYNSLTQIPNLPTSIKYLWCGNNLIDSLSNLPNGLLFLDCSNNLIQDISTLPDSIRSFNCDYNQIDSIYFFPPTLTHFSCMNNNISFLPTLPPYMKVLSCNNNVLTNLPSLPNELTFLRCSSNQLTSLPLLPDSLTDLLCQNNQLTSVPSFPSKLIQLICSYNQISILPNLPPSLVYLTCDHNQITSIPAIPDTLTLLECSQNPIECLPELKNIKYLYFDSTLVDCVPLHGLLSQSIPIISNLPICDVFNSNGCDVFWNIEGTIYLDEDTNCIFGNNDKGSSNLRVNLYKNGLLDQQTYIRFDGNYNFNTSSFDIYKTELDTTGLSFEVNCPSTGFYLDTISAIDSIKYDRDFALKCKGVDLASTSINSMNLRPASLRTINIFAGDFTNFYGFNCSAGTSGTVTITVSGACNYVSSPSYALTPTTVIGNVLTHSIADFGAISYDSTFDFNLLVDTTASLGSQICITVNVATVNTELNYNNNQLTQCFTVVGSFDPNDKAVYPQSIMEVNSDRWLNYTIRFQNTGTAEAEHIFITDTLSSLLDKSTFTLLSYSHEPFVQLFNDGLLKFNFPNIHLPDSNTNEPASHGYVQYKIRAKDSVAIGSTIDNTANIFFDFNAPVITNTVSNTVINCSLLQATITQTAGTLEANLANANYQWINCTTGTAIVGANTQTYNPTQSGNYAVVVDFGTCMDTSGCFYFSPVGINEINTSNISIQPNPFNNELKITLDKNYNGVIEIYNSIGAIITSEKLQGRNVTHSTGSWNAGVYILKVATNAGVVVKKIIKK